MIKENHVRVLVETQTEKPYKCPSAEEVWFFHATQGNKAMDMDKLGLYRNRETPSTTGECVEWQEIQMGLQAGIFLS